MEQTYTKLFSTQAMNMGLRAKPSIAIGAGKQRCVTVKVTGFGRVIGLSVKQVDTDGTQVAFTVELLKSKKLFPPDVDVVAPATPTDDLTLYRVIPEQEQATPGAPIEIEPGGTGFAYRNMDAGYTNQERNLYLVITPDPTANVATNWDAAVTIVQDN